MKYPNTILVGAGVVGRAILKAHVDAGISVCVADQDEASVVDAIERLSLNQKAWQISDRIQLGDRLSMRTLTNLLDHDRTDSASLVIESILERLDIKQAFFAQAENLFGDDAVLCSNTSTLRIGTIAKPLNHPERFCGMHFFMPVDRRPAVELVRGESTSQATVDRCVRHTHRLGKEPLVVADSPGFIVNRLLSPYLNEAMLLLGRGVSAARIERAAIGYGMPMSPLELVDWIGTRTMFDAGRVYWQSFPTRIDPSPILPALVKRKQLGRMTGAGFYEYAGIQRSAELSAVTLELCDKYHREFALLTDEDILQLLSIPMWIEAAIAYREGTVASLDHFDVAMRGGLGYSPAQSWLGFFDSLGSQAIAAAIDRWSPVDHSMRAPTGLTQSLRQYRPRESIGIFAQQPEG